MLSIDEVEAFLASSVDGFLSLSAYTLDERRIFDVCFARKNEHVRLSGGSLEEALLLAIRPPQKRCTRCRLLKDLKEFGRSPSHKDGHASHCLICDRRRKKKWYKRASRRQAQRHANALEQRPPTGGAATRSPFDN